MINPPDGRGGCLAQTTVRRIRNAFGLQPHRSEAFRPSGDSDFTDKVRDIVGLYPSPPDRTVVFRVDEKSRIWALGRTQPVSPLRPGIPERRTYDYRRNRTTPLFAVPDLATGFVNGSDPRAISIPRTVPLPTSRLDIGPPEPFGASRRAEALRYLAPDTE